MARGGLAGLGDEDYNRVTTDCRKQRVKGWEYCPLASLPQHAFALGGDVVGPARSRAVPPMAASGLAPLSPGVDGAGEQTGQSSPAGTDLRELCCCVASSQDLAKSTQARPRRAGTPGSFSHSAACGFCVQVPGIAGVGQLPAVMLPAMGGLEYAE